MFCSRAVIEHTLPTMSDVESYAGDRKDAEKPIPAKDLEPFGNEETAEVKYRTMKWW